MARRRARPAGFTTAWTQALGRGLVALTRHTARANGDAVSKAIARASGKAVSKAIARASGKAVGQAVKRAGGRSPAPAGAGDWITGIAMGAGGARRFRLYRPPGVAIGERLPLLVMLHGCGQDATQFAASTRMNRLAARERFLVLYPEQDRLANAQGCWNWFDTTAGRAQGEAALILRAIDQVCLLYAADAGRVAVAGLSAGASMAALLATLHPARFKAVAMHSGVPPGTAHSTLSALGAMHGHRATAPLKAPRHALPAPWPPLLVIHGGRDSVVSPHNGQAAVQAWADATGARARPARTVQRGKRHAMTVTDHVRRGGTPVVTHIEIARLAHAWSGGAASQPYGDALGPDASRLVWAFAARQFRAGALSAALAAAAA